MYAYINMACVHGRYVYGSLYIYVYKYLFYYVYMYLNVYVFIYICIFFITK